MYRINILLTHNVSPIMVNCNITYGSSVNCTIGSLKLVACTLNNCTIGILRSNRRRNSILCSSESQKSGGIWFCAFWE